MTTKEPSLPTNRAFVVQFRLQGVQLKVKEEATGGEREEAKGEKVC